MKRMLVFVLTFCLIAGGLVFPAGNAEVYATTTAQISCGYTHSLYLKDDGTVWAWGSNNYGQLGDGTTVDRYIPQQVPGIGDVIAIAGGNNFCLALKNDGTVWAWGHNNEGQLGDGTTTDRNTPIQITGLSNITAIACGNSHGLAIKNDGKVWAWGRGNEGQLGNGSTSYQYSPVQIAALSNIIFIACGNLHSLAIKNDGTVWTWGRNAYGQLGDGTTVNKNTPVQVAGLSNMTAVAGGQNFSLAIRSDGIAFSWGYNTNGLLGDGTTINRTSPVQVVNLTGVTAISAGDNHSIALLTDGTVWAWGYNSSGQLGNGTTNTSIIPVQVSDLTGITAISSGSHHNIVMINNGTLWGWGHNGGGRIGDGTTTLRYTPVQVIGLFSPTAPTNLSATSGDAQVSLSWDPVTGTDSYTVKRADTTGGPYTTVASSITETTYTDTDLTNGITYYYVVSATNSGGESADSNEASATPQEAAPGAPANLTATAGDGLIMLSWNAAEGALSYNVKRAETTGGPYTTIADAVVGTSFTDTDLITGATYYYVVSATNSGGESADSNEASATLQGQEPVVNATILELTMTNGAVKEYDMSAVDITAFLNWYDARSNGTGPAYIALSKAFLNGPFVNRKEYVQFEKIYSFEVMEY